MKKLVVSLAACAALSMAVYSQDAQGRSSYGSEVNNFCAPNGVQPYTGNCALCHIGGTGSGNFTPGASDYSLFCPDPVPTPGPDPTPTCTDNDGDGFFLEAGCGSTVDCDDSNAWVYPGATENCTDGIDNDCDQLVDMGDPNAFNCPTNCADNDQDGYSPDGGSCGPVDCNDNDASRNPGATEICGDNIDQDCSGSDQACDSGGGNTGGSHPFGWSDPEDQHEDYVEDNGVGNCISCHSIDSADRGSSMSCYRCHGQEWDDPNDSDGDSDDDEVSPPDTDDDDEDEDEVSRPDRDDDRDYRDRRDRSDRRSRRR